MAFAVLGTLTGLAAVLNAVRFNQIPSNAGIGLEMKVIASVVVGGASVAGGTGSVMGTVLGVVLLAAIGPALTFLGVSAYWERAIQGGIILVGCRGRRHPSSASHDRRAPSGGRSRPRAGRGVACMSWRRRWFPNGEWVLLLVLAARDRVLLGDRAELSSPSGTSSRSPGSASELGLARGRVDARHRRRRHRPVGRFR